MIEEVGKCVNCSKIVYCTDGFLNGIIEENGSLLCFECSKRDEVNKKGES